MGIEDFPDLRSTLARGGPVTQEQSRTCPACLHVFPAWGHFCPACGYAMHSSAGVVEMQHEEEEGPVALFRRRRIAFGSLGRPLQVLLLLVLGQIGVVAILLATRELPQIELSNVGVYSGGQGYQAPLSAFLVLAISSTLGLWFALAGAMRVHWSMRFLVVALVTELLAFLPMIDLNSLSGLHDLSFVLQVAIRWGQLALLAIYWLWAGAITWREWRTRGQVRPGRPWHGRSFWLAVVPLLLYYGLELAIWRVHVALGPADEGASGLIMDIGSQAITLPPFLMLLIFWYSTDLLEWGEVLSRSVVGIMRRVRVPWLPAALTALVAVGVLINNLRMGQGLLPGLVLSAIMIGLVLLLKRFARMNESWPVRVPRVALFLGAMTLYVEMNMSQLVEPPLLAHGLALEQGGNLVALLFVPVLLLALILALFLLARGRSGHPRQGVVGLFLALIVVLNSTASLGNILNAAGIALPQAFQSNYHLLAGIQTLAAAGVLSWLGRLLVRKQSLSRESWPLVSAFHLLVGLQIIDWLGNLANGLHTLGERSALLLAGVFVLTALWDLITSGEQMTNTSTPAFPREGRVLLSLAYTLASTALLLFVGSLRTARGAVAPEAYSLETYAPIGLQLLGPCWVALTFLLRMEKLRRRQPTLMPVTSPVQRLSPRRMQLGILGGGSLALLALILFLSTFSIPRLIRLSQPLENQSYTTSTPGPDCDPGKADWTIAPGTPISLHCLPTGTQVTIASNKAGAISFAPPEYLSHAQNYRISLQIDPGHAPDSCIGIFTQSSTRGNYASQLCFINNLWGIYLSDSTAKPSISTLRQGLLPPAHLYTLEAATIGAYHLISINGTVMASVRDTTLASGSMALTMFNSGAAAEALVLSHFAYTPLPSNTPLPSVPTPTPTPRITRPSFVPATALLAFSDPLTRPNIWQDVPANAAGSTCQFVPGGYQVEVKKADFLDGCAPTNQSKYSNFAFEVYFRVTIGSCGGLAFRQGDAPENTPGYYWLLCDSGYYALLKVTPSGQSIPLIQATPASAIFAGYNATNLMGVVADGSKLSFYVNGQLITSYQDSTFSQGQLNLVAAYVQGQTTPTQVIYWNANMWVW